VRLAPNYISPVLARIGTRIDSWFCARLSRRRSPPSWSWSSVEPGRVKAWTEDERADLLVGDLLVDDAGGRID
jgi:hypothetical protein